MRVDTNAQHYASRQSSEEAGFTAIELFLFVVNVALAALFAGLVHHHSTTYVHANGWRIALAVVSFVIGFALACVCWYGLLRAIGLIIHRRHLSGHAQNDTTTKA